MFEFFQGADGLAVFAVVGFVVVVSAGVEGGEEGDDYDQGEGGFDAGLDQADPAPCRRR